MAKILLVDDDLQSLESTRKILEFSGHEVVVAQDGQAALELIRAAPDRISQSVFDLVLTDVRMPRLGGLEFLRAISLCGESMPVILMTAFGRVEDAVWAMKLGAVDFLTKPFKRQTLVAAVDAAIKRSRPRAKLRGKEDAPTDLTGMIGESQAMKQLRSVISQVAPTMATVLISGESGTGKELVARSIHQQSTRAQKPFIALNCAAVPEQLIESELFGFEKGSFTGATAAKEGLIEAANGGTLLLDEIGDTPLSLQAKLLRVLQESEVRRLGATVSKKVDVRIIGASHKDLKESVRAGTFRQDLLFRLEVISLLIPPLRDRLEDVPGLAYHFLHSASQRHGKSTTSIGAEAMHLLSNYSWPGNVRELSNVIERAVVFANGDEVLPADLPSHIALQEFKPKPSSNISVPLGTSLREVEDLLIRKTMEATSGDKNMTARLLGINSRTIYRKLDGVKKVEREPES